MKHTEITSFGCSSLNNARVNMDDYVNYYFYILYFIILIIKQPNTTFAGQLRPLFGPLTTLLYSISNDDFQRNTSPIP